jgi:hypothetical protein
MHMFYGKACQEITVALGEIYAYTFPVHFQARWLRFTADRPTATA